MKLKFIIFCAVVIVSIIFLIACKKIRPDFFKPYLIWVLFIDVIALILYKPWMMFI